jgi:hypothetical protein
MGVDLGGIIEHNLNPKEILEIPIAINDWDEIRALKKSHEFCSYNYDKRFETQLKSNSKWSEDIAPTEESLLTIWDFYETGSNGACSVNPFQNRLSTFWGEIRFFRKVAIITHSPGHKYGNLQYPEIAHNLLSVNRKIAKQFNADKIVYCPDSGFPTETVWHEAWKGQSLDEHIYKMNKLFFEPPKTLNKAIMYYYFIDDFSSELNNFKKWTWDDSPWIYNEETNRYEFKPSL